jgi:hypothetical protein
MRPRIGRRLWRRLTRSKSRDLHFTTIHLSEKWGITSRNRFNGRSTEMSIEVGQKHTFVGGNY